MRNVEKIIDFKENRASAVVDKERWVSINILYDDYERIYDEVVRDTSQYVLNKNWASEFFIKFRGDRGEYLQFIFRTTLENLEVFIKPYIEEKVINYFIKYSPFESKTNVVSPPPFSDSTKHIYIDYIDFKILTFAYSCGMRSADRLGELVSLATRQIRDAKTESPEEWGEDHLIPKAVPYHLAFLLSLGLSIYEINRYYFTLYLNVKELMGEADPRVKEDPLWSDKFDELMENNFLPQKEGFVGYCEFLIENILDKDEFDEEWLNHWCDNCFEVSNAINQYMRTGEFVTHAEFVDETSELSKSTERVWPILEHIIVLLDKALGLTTIQEFNLFYMMMRTTEILNEQSLELDD